MAENAKDYALVVGINDYPEFRSLKGAVKDATDFAGWVTDKVIGGGVPEAPAKQCEVVLSSPNPIRPIQDDVDDALERLMTLARASGGGRRFYLYFSGHGIGAGPDTALCLARWSDNRRNLALDSSSYQDYLKDTGLFAEVVTIMDCCRVKKVNAKGLPCTCGVAGPDPNSGATRHFVAHATESLRPAYEAVVAATTGANGEEVRGHFTRALLEALYGAVSEPTGGVTASQLKTYLETETPIIAKDAGHEQRPEVVDGLPGHGNPTFGSAPLITSVKVNFTFGAAREGEIALDDGNLTTVLQKPATSAADWNGLALPPALYSLRDLASGATKQIRIRAVRGEFNVNF